MRFCKLNLRAGAEERRCKLDLLLLMREADTR